jgi:hypothetical protein
MDAMKRFNGDSRVLIEIRKPKARSIGFSISGKIYFNIGDLDVRKTRLSFPLRDAENEAAAVYATALQLKEVAAAFTRLAGEYTKAVDNQNGFRANTGAT